MKATQRVSALRGGQPDDLIARGAGCEGIWLRDASMRRKIGPNRPRIQGMSDQLEAVPLFCKLSPQPIAGLARLNFLIEM
jgi:hypothetical protein